MTIQKHDAAFGHLAVAFVFSLTGLFCHGIAADDTVSLAKSLFDKGIDQFSKEQYSDALAAFESSYATHPRSATLFNMAMCNKALMRNKDAIELFESFLEENSGDDEMRADASKALDELLRLVGIVEFAGALDGSSVWINDTVVGKTPLDKSIVLNPGIYRVHVALEGYLPLETTVSVTAGARNRIWVKLAPEHISKEPVGPTPPKRVVSLEKQTLSTRNPANPATADQRRQRALLDAGLVTGMTGIVAIGVGVFFSVQYIQNRNKGNLAATKLTEIWDESNVDIYNEADENMKKNRVGMVIGYTVGGVLMSSAVLMLALYGYRHATLEREKANVAITAGTVTVGF